MKYIRKKHATIVRGYIKARNALNSIENTIVVYTASAITPAASPLIPVVVLSRRRLLYVHLKMYKTNHAIKD